MFYQLSHLGRNDYFTRENGENFSYPPHLHQSFELILIKDGEMNVTINDTTYRLSMGEAVLIFPNQIHSMSSVKSSHTLFIFAPQFIESYWAEKSTLIPQDNRVRLDERAFSYLLELENDSSRLEIKGALYLACAQFDKNKSYKRITEQGHTTLFKILSFIEENFKKECSLSTISSNIGYSEEYISRFFSRSMKITFNQFLNARRLNHAAHLLQSTNEAILTLALESGYTSLRSFNRNFKLYYGMTPNEYRNMNR